MYPFLVARSRCCSISCVSWELWEGVGFARGVATIVLLFRSGRPHSSGLGDGQGQAVLSKIPNNPLTTGRPRFGSVRLRFGNGTVQAVPVFGSGGSSAKKRAFCVSVQFKRKERFRFRFRFLERFWRFRFRFRFRDIRFRRFRFPVQVRFLSHPVTIRLNPA